MKWLGTNNLDIDVLITFDTNIYYGELSVQQPIKDIGSVFPDSSGRRAHSCRKPLFLVGKLVFFIATSK